MEQNHPSNLNQSYFENTGFQNKRTKKQILILDVVSFDTALKDFKLILPEPLIIDELSDIYLDSFTTLGTKPRPPFEDNVSQNMGFRLQIDEFKIQSKIATNILQGGIANINKTIYIPNDTSIENRILKIHQNTGAIGGGAPAGNVTARTIDNVDTLGGRYNGHGIGMLFSLVLKESIAGIDRDAVVSATITNTGSNYRAGEQITINAVELTALTGNATTTINTDIILEIPSNFTSGSVSTTHKGKKLNYICSMNPTTLSNISGKITDMGKKNNGGVTNFSDPAFPIVYESPFENPGDAKPNRFIAEFLIIPRE